MFIIAGEIISSIVNSIKYINKEIVIHIIWKGVINVNDMVFIVLILKSKPNVGH